MDYSTYQGTSYYYIYLNAGDASASGAANPGDTIVVSDSDASVPDHRHRQSYHRCARRLGWPRICLLTDGVHTITLADYAPGQGANVTVTGNGEGDTITGNSGNDTLNPGDATGPSTLTGGAGSDTFVMGTGDGAVTITDFDQGNTGAFTQGEGDKLDIVGVAGVQSFSDIQSDAIRVDANGTVDPNGPDTLINLGNGDTLTLDNVTPDS